jgi:hypothetical protein
VARKQQSAGPQDQEAQPAGHRVRVPGFLIEDEIALGDAVKKVTYAMGIKKPCSGCESRATTLNHWMTFVRR